MKNLNNAAALTLCVLFANATPAHATTDDAWQWSVEPYVWGASVGTDLHTERPPTDADNSTRFGDVVKKLDGVFMLHAEAQNERWGVMSDFIYLGISDTRQRRFQSTRTDLDARLFDLALSLRLSEQRDGGAEIYSGLRYLDVDLTTQFQPDAQILPGRTLDLGKHYADFLLGARYTWALSSRWSLAASADASAGATEGTFSGALMGQYRMQSGAWMFGYRYFQADFGNGNLDARVSLQGPQVGYAIHF